MKKLLLLAVIFFPHLAFADDWTVIHTNKAEYPLDSILQETDIIDVKEGQFIMIRNIEKKQTAFIIIPGERTVLQAVEEAKYIERLKSEQSKANTTNRDRNDFYIPNFLFYERSGFEMPLFVQE